jgi:hypothetical protein
LRECKKQFFNEEEIIMEYGNCENAEISILKEFLKYPLGNDGVDKIMDRFAELPNAVYRKCSHPQQRFVFVKGERIDAATLVAHADTVFDGDSIIDFSEDGKIKSARKDAGIGADDRAGCAILWLLRNSGHNLLITDGEEIGRIGAKYLMNENPDIAETIQNSSFVIQFDRRNARDYKCYNLPVSQKFRDYIEIETGFSEPNKSSSTDIVDLCKKVCGVNLSTGYYNEHKKNEYIVISEWLGIVKIAEKMLGRDKKLERFPII